MITHSHYSPHRPHHLYVDNWCYFITSRCIEGKHLFNTPEKKQKFIQVFNQSLAKYNVKAYSWVLINNHYHIMLQIPKAKILKKFIQNLQTNSSRVINKNDQTPGRQVWYQYWDYCIRNEKDFWKHFNYIIQNPLKHKLVKTLAEAYHYKYSSNPTWLKQFSEEGLSEGFIKYPVKDWTPYGYDD